MASTQTSPRLLTADEFYKLPNPIEGGKMELVRGEVVYEMPVGGEHGILTTALIFEFESFVRRNPIGIILNEAGFRLFQGPDTVRAPDVAFIANARLPEGGIKRRGYIPSEPTLAIEVYSPNDRARDMADKVRDYLGSGVERVWVVRPSRKTVTVHRAGGEVEVVTIDSILTSDHAAFEAPGFELKLRDLY